MTLSERIQQIVALAYSRLCGKVARGRLVVANEASLQLQFASILKTLGELYEESSNERFNIELEKAVFREDGVFPKSGTSKAQIDVWISLANEEIGEGFSCAIELKFFRQVNHREPNNRYDTFKDLQNLELYGEFADIGFLLVATDHMHYVNQEAYSPDTADFDFRDGAAYRSGTTLTYRTRNPFGPPIELQNNYAFAWQVHAHGPSLMCSNPDLI